MALCHAPTMGGGSCLSLDGWAMGGEGEGEGEDDAHREERIARPTPDGRGRIY